jgi:hypothetical protein
METLPLLYALKRASRGGRRWEGRGVLEGVRGDLEETGFCLVCMGIYVGSLQQLQDQDYRSLVGLEGVQGIILCNKEWGGENRMVELPISDGENGLQYFLKNVGQFVCELNKMETDGGILCCWKGQSRSWFLVGVYLMVYKGWSFKNFIAIRTEILGNSGGFAACFTSFLEDLEVQLEHFYHFYKKCKREKKSLIGYTFTGRIPGRKRHRNK